MQLSGMQLMVNSLSPSDFPDNKDNPKNFPITFKENEEHHCCVCGGTLTELTTPRKNFSGTWISQAELDAKDEEERCAACSWITTGKSNRQNLFSKRECPITVFNGDERRAFSEIDFIEFLVNDEITYPCIIAIMDKSDRDRKHTMWQVNRGVTYGPDNLCIHLFGMSGRGQGSYIEGTARVNLDWLVETVKSLREVIQTLKQDKKYQAVTKPEVQFGIAKGRFYSICAQHGLENEESLFAMRLAFGAEFPKKKKEEGQHPTAKAGGLR